MKIYNYLLFRLYTTLSKNKQYSEGVIDYLATIISTLYIYILFYTFWAIVNFYFLPSIDERNFNKAIIAISILLITYLNYYFFIKEKKFLNQNFKEDKTGGYSILGLLIFSFIIFIIVANKNRERITNQNKNLSIEKQNDN
nr:hypothetical protein [uncultured Flavobacterium sp.]